MQSFAEAHQEALELDCQIVESLLQRNRCSHQRTKYYQRLSMFFSALQRHEVLLLFGKTQQLKADIEKAQQYQKRKRKREAVFWEVKKTEYDDGDNNCDTTEEQKEYRQFRDRLIQQSLIVFKHLPTDIIPRIEYAAEAFFREIARGFFLPFCTVAVAAVARIRTLLMSLGSQSVQQLHQLESILNETYRYHHTPPAKKTSINMPICTKSLISQANAVYFSTNLEGVENTANKLTKEQRLEQDLRNLGIPARKKQKSVTAASSNGTSEDGDDDKGLDQDEKKVTKLSLGASAVSVPDDLGESVDLLANVPSILDSPQRFGFASTKSTSSSKTVKQSRDQMDRNMVLVEQLKAKQKKDEERLIKKEKKKKKSKKRVSPAANSEETMTKKKKTKKADKRDFFDDLFG